MRKILVTLEIDIDEQDAGFAIVPTASRDVLDHNRYVVATPPSTDKKGWGCKNGVILKEEGTF